MKLTAFRNVCLLLALLVVSACAGSIPAENIAVSRDQVPGYGEVHEGHLTIPAVDPAYLVEPNRRMSVSYAGGEAPGTIIVDPYAKFLYFVQPGGTALRYPVATGRAGRGFSGRAIVGMKREWPGWTPTQNMIREEPEFYGPFARGIPGGKASPLGARALYLYRGGRDTYYRIHGTNDPAVIGNAGSAGCIRMFNQDIIDLYERVPYGAQVIVRTYEQSVAAEGLEMANRGSEIPPRTVNPEEVYALVEEERQRKAEYETGL
jgi:lipoprotein-anchoring transpeptidase ErfK/SrfK